MSLSSKLHERIHRACTEGVFPGCVVGVVDRMGERIIIAHGAHTFDQGARCVAQDSIFDVASITKAIPVSCLALSLVDKGTISLDNRVMDFLPQLLNSHRESITIRHLLTQTLDFGWSLASVKNLSPPEILHEIFTREMRSPPGKVFSYCNATSILLGLAIERVSLSTLDECAHQVFFDALEMHRTSFFPERLPIRDIVPTERDPWRGRAIVGEIHDESAWALRPAVVAGSAGLFSTVPDLLSFLSMLLNGGVSRDRRFFSSDKISAMATNQIPHLGGCAGLGWELNQDHYMGVAHSPQTIGKTGFTGCMTLCDFVKGLGVVMLSNFTWPQRRSKELIHAVRRDIADMVFLS